MLARKKPQVIESDKLKNVIQNACTRAVLARISSSSFKFNGVFLECDETGIVMDNRLMHLDDVRRLRNQELTLFFPYRKTLLKGTVRLVGLTTFKSIRALRFTYPEKLVTDEKRGVKRVSHLPTDCEITFHTPDLHIFHARIHDASPSGFALVLPETTAFDDNYLVKGKRFQAEGNLDQDLKLSFKIEIRHVATLPKNGALVGAYKVGVKIVKLTQEAQARLNNWLLKCNIREQEIEENVLPTKQPKHGQQQAQATNSILVIGPDSIDLDFWYQCLGRKYEVITSDDNIANIRDSLNTGPALLLMFIDTNNSAKASFTRKFCSSLNNRFPIMFFGKEPDPKKQTTLMAQVPNHGFLDISERKLLNKFRLVDEVMNQIKGR